MQIVSLADRISKGFISWVARTLLVFVEKTFKIFYSPNFQITVFFFPPDQIYLPEVRISRKDSEFLEEIGKTFTTQRQRKGCQFLQEWRGFFLLNPYLLQYLQDF